MTTSPTREIPGDQLQPGMLLVGDQGHHAAVGEVRPSSAMPGLLQVETEFGPLYLDPDHGYTVVADDPEVSQPAAAAAFAHLVALLEAEPEWSSDTLGELALIVTRTLGRPLTDPDGAH